MRLKAKTKEDAEWLSLLIVGVGGTLLAILLELPAWLLG